MRSPLQKQQSLPLRPLIPLVARISDQNASGAPPMTVREKTRLEKFRQLLSSHNTDLGEWGTLRVGRAEGLLPALGGRNHCLQLYQTGVCRNRPAGRW